MRLTITGFVFACSLLCCHADSVITTPTWVVGYEGNRTSGFSFSVGLQPLSVTSLGILDTSNTINRGPDGLQEPHLIGLWDTSGSLLVSVSIAAGNSGILNGGFRYIDLDSPITLNAGQTYVLGASFTSGNELFSASIPTEDILAGYSSFVIPGDVRWSSSGGFSFPDVIPGSGAIIGPNAQFVAVPEPSGVCLGIAGFGLFALRNRTHGKSSARLMPESP